MTSRPLDPDKLSWTTPELLEWARAAVSGSDQSLLRPFEGRWVGVLNSPILGNAEHLALGVSVLPSEYAAPTHSHSAEEVAVVVAGSGVIEVDGSSLEVQPGSIVFTPSDSPHRTIAAADGLTILWIYAPAGSEDRWVDSPQD